ncbi:ArsR/SmtB family transcription factor [Lignipirellula cremea]|uniref:Transcriptional repressor SdpR n=1 Tax=Lignipirellula cremea TaxID=2528010 RepID=A0A518E4N9_9BACT|nr:metalloregulator ArsR/SmtB family transcription factor [Lignipirellula cremea]QDU99060.1 Transcriptional repressor SdpR [Lignipirellula cremea]
MAAQQACFHAFPRKLKYDLAKMKNAEEFQQCAERLKALADPERLRIVLTLFTGEMNVGQIADSLGEDMVKVSHHLGVLRHAHIVTTQREGRFVKYRLHPEVAVHSEGEGNGHWIEFGCCRVDLTSAAQR